MANNTPLTSDFYWACHEGEVDKVKNYMKNLTTEQLNKIEPNGSTALHAASFYGNEQIVRLLLEKGVSRSIRNRYSLTAYEEASTDEVKKLFQRQSATDRFVGGMQGEQIEWMKVDSEIKKKAADQRKLHNQEWDKLNICGHVKYIREKYINKSLQNIDGIDLINYYYIKAYEDNDPVQVLTAYTAETDYYKVLNHQLAVVHEDSWSDGLENRFGRNKILTIMTSHPSLSCFTFFGFTYRGMRVTETNLSQYVVGTQLMNKAFLSTSKDRQIAESFAKQVEETNDGKIGALCSYDIRNNRS
ncbi:unnamed protein product, partial [Didymodactylos carnosus]